MTRMERGFFLVCLFALTGLIASSDRCASAWAQSNPVPFLNQPLVPDAVAPGGQGFTLTVNGAGFSQGAVVQWNGSPLSTSFVTASRLTATVPASDIATATTAVITVNNGSSGEVSNGQFLEISAVSPGVAFSPNSVAANVSGQGAQATIATDVNRDGKLDIITADFNGTVVSVLLGNGDGTFQAPIEYTVGSYPQNIIAGDFNNDGLVDLAIEDLDGAVSGYSVLLGNGDGTFQAPIMTPGASIFPYVLVEGDFNRDGKLDLAGTVYPGQVVVSLGNGDGTFQSPAEYTVGASPLGLCVGDFNGDGNLDLVATATGDGAVAVLLGNGDGTFQSFVEYPTPAQPYYVSAADFNGDGNLDLVVTAAGNFSILLGDGNGAFQGQPSYHTPPLAVFPVTGDFNDDGKLDVVDTSLSSIQTFFGNGDGTFQTPPGSVPLNDSGITGITSGDFNRDGRLDLLTDDTLNGAALVLLEAPSVLAPTQVPFGDVRVGTRSSPVKITLTNIGTADFTVLNVALAGSGKVNFMQQNNCRGRTLPANGSCTISATFTPKKTGSFQAAIAVRDTADSATQTVSLIGLGTP